MYFIENLYPKCWFCGETISKKNYNITIKRYSSVSGGGRIYTTTYHPLSLLRCEKCYNVHRLRNTLANDYLSDRNPYTWISIILLFFTLLAWFFLIFILSFLNLYNPKSYLLSLLLSFFISGVLAFILTKKRASWNENYRNKKGLYDALYVSERVHPQCRELGSIHRHPQLIAVKRFDRKNKVYHDFKLTPPIKEKERKKLRYCIFCGTEISNFQNEDLKLMCLNCTKLSKEIKPEISKMVQLRREVYYRSAVRGLHIAYFFLILLCTLISFFVNLFFGMIMTILSIIYIYYSIKYGRKSKKLAKVLLNRGF